MTRLVCLSLLTVALTAVRAGTAHAADSCVGDIVELAPDTVKPEERALDQSVACASILANKDDKKFTACPDAAAAIDFCTDPLTAKVDPATKKALAGDALLSAGKEADSGTCNASGAIKVQSIGGSFALGTSFQNDLLRGLAQFIVARAKAEAMAFLVDHIKDDLCATDDGKALAVHTCALVESSDPTGGAPMAWGTLRAAFAADLQVLPERAVACLANHAGANDDARNVLVTGVQIATLVRKGDDPFAVLAGLTVRFPDQTCTKDPGGCYLNLIGYEFRVLTPVDLAGKPRVPPDLVLYGKIAARRIGDHAVALGLVDAATEGKALEELSTAIARLDTDLRRLVVAVDQVKVAIAAAKDDPTKFQATIVLAHAVVELVRTAGDIVPASVFPGHDAGKQKLADLLAIVDEIVDATAAAIEGDYATTFTRVATSTSLMASHGLGKALPDGLGKYGPFLAEVATAKTPDDVERALDAAAAPVGGGLAKRGSGRRTIALTAYLGWQLGSEYTPVSNGNTVSGTQTGVFAPVGVDVTWGVCKKLSLGLMFSAIDLGALASWRTSDPVPAGGAIADGSKVETSPEIGFREVLSPGLYGVLGIDRFALGVGASMSPQLREITKDGMLVEHDSALRVGVFVAIDVTLFPF